MINETRKIRRDRSRPVLANRFVLVEKRAKPEVYFGLPKVAHTEDSAKVIAKAFMQAKKATTILTNQLGIAIRLRRLVLDVDPNKAALVLTMPADQILLIFKYALQPNMTAELLLPIFNQYVAAKQVNPTIDPMIWQYVEPQ